MQVTVKIAGQDDAVRGSDAGMTASGKLYNHVQAGVRLTASPNEQVVSFKSKAMERLVPDIPANEIILAFPDDGEAYVPRV